MAVNWFERLFPSVRALESELAQVREALREMTQEKLLLQDRLQGARVEREKLWDMVHEALHRERTAYQMHINQSWQRMGAGIPYPEAPHIPPQAVPKPPGSEPVGRQGRILPSEAVAQRTAEFLQSFIKE